MKWHIKLYAIIIMACVGLVISGCAQKPENVKLASEKTMLRRCVDTYGNCEIIGYTDNRNERIYSVLDIEKDFLYSARTYARTIWLDTVWGYTEDWRSDFDEKYLDGFLDEYGPLVSNFETEYDAKFDFQCYTWLVELSARDTDNAMIAAEKLDGLLAEYDARGYWGEFEIRILIDGESNGMWRHGTGCMAPADELAEWFMTVASSEMRGSVNDLEFIRLGTVLCADLDGYAEIQDKLMNILGSDNRTKTETQVAWFRYKNNTYWIADLCYQDGNGHIRHLGNFPSRYE